MYNLCKTNLRVVTERLCLVVVIASVSAALAGCDNNRARGPVLHLSTTTLDFGRVARPALCAGDFVLRNTGAEPLSVLTTKKSCGCLKVNWEGIPSEIAAGQSCTLQVEFRPKKIGEDGGFVFLSTNDPAVPSIELNVQAFVTEEIMISPPAFSLVDLMPNEKRVIELILKSKIELGTLLASSETLSVDIEKIRRDEDEYKVTLACTVPEDAPVRGEGELKLLTESELFPVLAVPYHFNQTPYVRCNPEKLYVSREEASSGKWTKRVKLISNNGNPFDIIKITPNNLEVGSSVIKDAEENAVSIQFSSNGTSKNEARQIRYTITTTHPNQEMVQCQLVFLDI
jgi:hypothetical protein